jgi:hypothetical protein
MIQAFFLGCARVERSSSLSIVIRSTSGIHLTSQEGQRTRLQRLLQRSDQRGLSSLHTLQFLSSHLAGVGCSVLSLHSTRHFCRFPWYDTMGIASSSTGFTSITVTPSKWAPTVPKTVWAYRFKWASSYTWLYPWNYIMLCLLLLWHRILSTSSINVNRVGSFQGPNLSFFGYYLLLPVGNRCLVMCKKHRDKFSVETFFFILLPEQVIRWTSNRVLR